MRCPHCKKAINLNQVWIKIIGTREDKSKAFYEMITHGNTFSETKDEFLVDKSILDMLDVKGIKYKRIKS